MHVLIADNFVEILSCAYGDFEQQIKSRNFPSPLIIYYSYYTVYYNRLFKNCDVKQNGDAADVVTTPYFKILSNITIYNYQVT